MCRTEIRTSDFSVTAPHPPFNRFYGLAGREIDCKIDDRDQDIGGYGYICRSGDRFRAPHELHHSERHAYGGFLHHSHDLVCKGGQDIFYRLGQHHQFHGLPAREAQGSRGLRLTGVDCKDPGPEDLGDVGRAVQGKGTDARDETGYVNKAEYRVGGDLN